MPSKQPLKNTKGKPSGQEAVTRTFQLRLDGNQPKLDDMADLFQTVKRTLYAEAQKTGATFDSLKTEYCEKYGLPRRLYNSMARSLNAMIKSVHEASKHHLIETVDRRVGAEKKLARLLAKRDAPLKPLSAPAKERRQRDIERARQTICRLGGKETRLQQQIDAAYPKICFGGRRLFNAQHLPENQSKKKHARWLKTWRDARANEFQVIGSEDEETGNKTCRARVEADGSVTLTLALAGARYKETTEFSGLRLRHGHDEFVRAIEMANLECRRAKAWQGETKGLKAGLSEPEAKTLGNARTAVRKAQPKLGFAIAYRFKRDAHSWRVFITITQPVMTVAVSFTNGAIGIDHNADHFAVALVGPKGALCGTRRMPAVLAGLSTGQRLAIVKHIAHQLVMEAKCLSVPLVIEELDFSGKKKRLREIGAKNARMLSSFGYTAFRAALVACAKRHGVAVVEVNPAWTSLIGAANYAVDNGISVHLAAAYVIARRAMRSVEEVPSSPRFSAGHERPFVLSTPTDLQSKASVREGIGRGIPGRKAWSWIATRREAEHVARLKRRPTGSQRRRHAAEERALQNWPAAA